MITPLWWETVHREWNEKEPSSHPVPGHPGERVWYARAWPWPNHNPYVGSGPTKKDALEALKHLLAKECGYSV